MTRGPRAAEPHGRRTLLIVEDEELVGRGIARAFEGRWPVRLAGTVEEGMQILEECSPLAAIVVDARLPDGSGLDVLRRARAKQPELQALVCTVFDDDEVVNAAQALGAEYAKKPDAKLGTFARRLAISDYVSDQRTWRYLDTYAAKHDLSLRETEVLALAIQDYQQEAIAKELSITKHTIKVHFRRIAGKCAQETLGEVAYQIRAALRDGRDGDPSA